MPEPAVATRMMTLSATSMSFEHEPRHKGGVPDLSQHSGHGVSPRSILRQRPRDRTVRASLSTYYFRPWEITSICADFVVELRGIEPLASQSASPCAWDDPPPRDPAELLLPRTSPHPVLERCCFTYPTRGYRLERLAGLGENRQVARRGLVTAYDHIDVQRIDFDASAHAAGLVCGDEG